MQRIYLDYNATTPVDPAVIAAMHSVLETTYGNPSSVHWFGQQARAVVEQARESVARLVGAQSTEIVFTSCGTESDNSAIRSSAAAAGGGRRKILYSAVEHHAVIHSARGLAEEGYTAESIRVGGDGTIDLEDLSARLDDRTALVALMLANNETGLIQPVAAASRLAHARGALILCDAVQAAGKIEIDVGALEVDLMALSAHKLYGPKGAGALYVRRGTKLRPFLRGGSQERNRRAGTENVAGIAGFGCAAGLARQRLVSDAPRLAALRDALEERLLAIDDATRNGSGLRVPNTTNVSFGGVEAESLVLALDLAGVAVATGAACASGAVEPSHVLKAMGLPAARIQASLRFSLGRGNTDLDVAAAAAAVAQAVARQRARR
jgi:cysteine desulfurase